MDQVFLQIFNTAITAGWLVLTVILARVLLKKAPAWIKCALWAIVALRLIWPFSIESVLSLLPSAEIIPPSQLYVPAPQVHTGISSLNAAINPVFTEAFRSEPMNSVNPLQVVMWIAGWVWVIGMVAMAVYAAISYLRIRRRVRVSIPAGEGVYLCDQIPAPFILGIVKPKIYLPSDLPPEKWDSILAHERAHLARRDHWWKPLGFALLTVFWFHPLLWVAYVLLCRDVELACDERVIKTLTAEEKQDYSNTLLECSIPGRWITACPLAFGETGVKQRIKAVLHYKKPTLWILIIAVIACTVLAVGFLTDPKTEQTPTVSVADVAGKLYIYEKEGAGGNFTLDVLKDGTFQYSAGILSSHLGIGKWEIKNGRLYLYDEGYNKVKTFVFDIQEDALVFCAAESDRFLYVDVADGEKFLCYGEITPYQPNLLWLTIDRVEEEYICGRDADGNTWRILIHDYISRLDISDVSHGVWVKFYGEAKRPDDAKTSGICYEVTANACWRTLHDLTAAEGKSLGFVYDYCRYDLDNDGVVEDCFVSMGPTSGLFTIRFSTWDGDVCEFQETIYLNYTYGFAFEMTQQGLSIRASDGTSMNITCRDGNISIAD